MTSTFLTNKFDNTNLRQMVDFTNILQAAFALTDSKSAKDSGNLTIFCAFGICTHKSYF